MILGTKSYRFMKLAAPPERWTPAGENEKAAVLWSSPNMDVLTASAKEQFIRGLEDFEEIYRIISEAYGRDIRARRFTPLEVGRFFFLGIEKDLKIEYDKTMFSTRRNTLISSFQKKMKYGTYYLVTNWKG